MGSGSERPGLTEMHEHRFARIYVMREIVDPRACFLQFERKFSPGVMPTLAQLRDG